MTVDEIKARFAASGATLTKEARLGNDAGTQLRFDGGQVINVFDNGTIQCQGQNRAASQGVLGMELGAATTGDQVPSNEVFVVYGHDEVAKTQLEAMLRRWGLEPLFLDQLPSEGQTLIEKLETYTGNIGFGIVLATPDDEGHRAGHDDEKSFRARQNVVLEMGMLLWLLGRANVAILLREQDKMERPSNIQGLIYIPFKDSVADARVQLAKEMSARGYDIAVERL